MNIFKKTLRLICYKIFYLGKVEYQHRIIGIKRKAYQQLATLHPEAVIANSGSIKNPQKNPSLIKVGKLSRILGELIVSRKTGEIIVGDHCYIGDGTRIWSSKKITIGNRVLISHNVNIHDNISHPYDAHERHRDFMHIFANGPEPVQDFAGEDVVIEDDVWIGFNATILKGVRIGKGSIVGACTVVTKDVPANSIVVGNIEQHIVKQIK